MELILLFELARHDCNFDLKSQLGHGLYNPHWTRHESSIITSSSSFSALAPPSLSPSVPPPRSETIRFGTASELAEFVVVANFQAVSTFVTMASRYLLLVCLSLVVTMTAAETAPKAVSIAFPPLDSRFICSIDPALGIDPKFICTPGTNPVALILSNDNDVVPARYQYKTPVQLWKKGSKYVASFSAYFTVNFDRSSEFTVRELFGGGGVAFAFTPTLSVVGTGPESFGLFPIDEKTGASKNGVNTKTVAVEIDISRVEANGFDPQIPHIGLDINSVKSVQTKYLGDPAAFIDNKIGVWIEYNALTKTIEVYLHKVKETQTPKRQNANIAIRYTGLDLAKEVLESSYVGFSSRVPQTENGVYKIYDFKFSTAWVLGTTVN